MMNLEVFQGECIGLIGRNGSGKTAVIGHSGAPHCTFAGALSVAAAAGSAVRDPAENR